MKKYFAPEIEITKFKALDIVTTSGGVTEPAELTVNDADHPASLNGTVGFVQ